MKRIEKLSLCAFRGATRPVEIEFESGKPIVMIFGGNGNGKSTIVDAIDFVCNEKYGSLSDRSSTKPKSHAPALGFRETDVKVALRYGGKEWAAQIGSNGRPVTTGPNERPQAVILRRHQILDVINEQPKKRYEALQRFITVSRIEKSEHSLRDAIRTTGQELNEAARAKLQAEEQLRKLWLDEGGIGSDYLQWAEEKVASDPAALRASVKTANEILSALDAALTARDTLQSAEEEYQKRLAARDAAEGELLKARSEDAEDADALIDLLQETERYLQKHGPMNHCPVCVREIEPTDLQGRISNTLAMMNEMVELKKKREETVRKVVEFVAILARAHETLSGTTRKLYPLVKGCSFAEVSALSIDWEQFSKLHGVIEPDDDLSEDAERLLATVEGCRTALIARRDTEQKALHQLTAIKNYLEAVREKTEVATNLDQTLGRLNTLVAMVETRRKQHVENVLDAISETVEELYKKIHPDEPVGNFRFYLKRNVIGSLEFDGQFETASGVPPQAYYSESHLDTLGICVFLAMVKRTNADRSIVVLDDVVTSVDNEHLQRFIGMLQDIAKDFSQLILTTHYLRWRDKFRRGNNKVQFIELHSWSLQDGIQIAKNKRFLDELQVMLKARPLKRQEIASKTGIYLEQLLDGLALHYRCKVPRQPEPNYDLSTLIDSVNSKLASQLRVEEWPSGATDAAWKESLRDLLVELKDLARIRNQVGCHYNEYGDEVTDEDVKLFTEKTITFAELLLCPKCGMANQKNADYWQCKCGRRRMYPPLLP